MLDLRLPIGWFFAITGLLLLGMGLFAPQTRAALTGANVNLYCGVLMTSFGALLLAISAFAGRRRS